MGKREKKPLSPSKTPDYLIRLVGDPEEWAKIPGNIVQRVETAGLTRLRQAHQNISMAANLLMPPIHVVPYGWLTPNWQGIIYAHSGPLLVDDGHEIGVLMPVTTPVFVEDDILLRRILVHEFSHCFYLIEQVLLTIASGKTVFSVDVPDLDAQERIEYIMNAEKRTRVNPYEWFSKEDAEQFLESNELVFDPSAEAFCRHWANEGLPICAPDLGTHTKGNIIFRSAIVKHAKKLRGEELKEVGKFLRIQESEIEK